VATASGRQGADIPVATEYTRNLRGLLDLYGNDPRLTLILFTLDESTYARELAPRWPGTTPPCASARRGGSTTRPRGCAASASRSPRRPGIYNTVGFNDDTRAFCSIPARHDLARRIDANWLGGLVARHQIDLDDARVMARALAYDLVRRTYKFDRAPVAALADADGAIATVAEAVA
jgi:glucuronate isomerase